MIIKPDGTKYPATREQLLQLAKSGVITPDTKVEVLGRIVSARKIQELAPIFQARGYQTTESEIDFVPVDEKSVSHPSSVPPTGNDPPGNSSSRSDTAGATTTGSKKPTIEERARYQIGNAFDPLVTMCVLIKIAGAISLIVGIIGAFFTAGLSLLIAASECLFLYFLYGLIRIIIFYVLKRAEDSIRQEDFNRDVMLQLKEIKERLE